MRITEAHFPEIISTAHHDIVPDTNAIYPKNPSDLFGTSFVNGIRKLIDDESETIEVQIPQMVLLERAHQRAETAKLNYEKIKSGSKILKESHNFEIPLENINYQVIERTSLRQLEEEAERLGFKIIPTPSENINWSQVVEDAAWRRAPFENNDTEKGFRDRVIFETVAAFCEDDTSNQIFFICDDDILADKTRLDIQRPLFSVESDLNSIFDQVRIKQKENKDFAIEVFSKIAKEFYDKEQNSGLFVDAGLQTKIRDQYIHTIQEPALAELYSGNDQVNPISVLLHDEELSQKRLMPEYYRRVGGLRYKIGSTHLESAENNVLNWKTAVELAGYFIGQIRTNRGSYAPKWIQSTRVSVYWKNKVSRGERVELLDSEFIKIDFESRNEINRFLQDPLAPTRYGFSLFTGMELFEGHPETEKDNKDQIIA